MHHFHSQQVCPSTTSAQDSPSCALLCLCTGLEAGGICKFSLLSTCISLNEGVFLLICRGHQQFVGDLTLRGTEPTMCLGNLLDSQLFPQVKCLLHFLLEIC